MGIDDGALGQAERNVGDAQDRVPVQFVPDAAEGLQSYQGALRIRRNCHGQTVDHDILAGYAIAVGGFIDFFRDRNAAVRSLRNPALVQNKADDYASVFSDKGKNSLEAFFFSIHGIDHGLAVVEAHPALQRGGVGGVDLQRQGQDALEPGDYGLHHPRFIDLGQANVDVQDMGAAFLLIQPFRQDVLNVVFAKGLFEFLFAGGVDPLTDNDRFFPDLHCL